MTVQQWTAVWLAMVCLTSCGRTPESLPGPGERSSATPREIPAPPPPAELTRAMAAAIAADAANADVLANDVARFYADAPDTPAWVDSAARPDRHADDALGLLARATSHGLDPADYGSTVLGPWQAALDRSTTLDVSTAAQFDVGLTRGLLRFVRDLHLGRVDPRALGFDLATPAEGHDFPRLVRAARDTGRLTDLEGALAPRVGQYRLLQQALAHYRTLAAENATPAIDPADAPVTLEETQAVLTRLGDLPGPDRSTAAPDEAVLRAALERFQRRHGLTVDGTLGPATSRALRVPMTQRVRQIELALERLRWLPDLDNRRVIVVNIPAFRLFAWDRAQREAAPALSMRIIVGRALDTRTPIFAGDLSEVVFRPYWNVPSTILRQELLPAIASDPTYLDRERLEIVAGQRDGSPVLATSKDAIARLASGQARVRQRPGPTNALGLVKFLFPNAYDVYMHSTPAAALFGRTRRDFSHGCIRVEDPAALAEWVLGTGAGWSRDSVLAAMDGPNNRRVAVTSPVHVMIVYTTAAVDPADNSVTFLEDVYALDPKLDRAL